MHYPLLFHPNLHTVVWGGHNILNYKKNDILPEGITAGTPIGESWEISAIDSSPSFVSNGPLAGLSLITVTQRWGAGLLGQKNALRFNGRMPLMMKIIDTAGDLSIQVHPNDSIALQRHHSFGKTEMWYIMSCQPGAYIYVGFSKELDEEEYRRRVADGTICDVLAKHEVHPGDVFLIPAGRVHSICAGITLCEVQQSSDITYRIFDYNRPGLDGRPRELHTAWAMDALDFHVESDYHTHYDDTADVPVTIEENPYFTFNCLTLTQPMRRDLRDKDTFVMITCLNGGVTIATPCDDPTLATVTLTEGNSCLIPATLANYLVTPLSQNTRVVEAYV